MKGETDYIISMRANTKSSNLNYKIYKRMVDKYILYFSYSRIPSRTKWSSLYSFLREYSIKILNEVNASSSPFFESVAVDSYGYSSGNNYSFIQAEVAEFLYSWEEFKKILRKPNELFKDYIQLLAKLEEIKLFSLMYKKDYSQLTMVLTSFVNSAKVIDRL